MKSHRAIAFVSFAFVLVCSITSGQATKPTATGPSTAPTSHPSTATAPHTTMFGTDGNAHHVVYVIDRSGSMLASFDVVRAEILDSISKLGPQQDFHIIFFSSPSTAPKEYPPHQLVQANKEQKNDAGVYLMSPQLSPSGQTDPVPALKRAFDALDRADFRRPGKLIYLLTDGPFPDSKKVLDLIAERNAKQEVAIYTFLYGEVTPEAEDVMKKIAKDSGGKYKQIKEDE